MYCAAVYVSLVLNMLDILWGEHNGKTSPNLRGLHAVCVCVCAVCVCVQCVCMCVWCVWVCVCVYVWAVCVWVCVVCVYSMAHVLEFRCEFWGY